MAVHAPLPLAAAASFGETKRTDAWWVQPLVVFLILSSFIGYATWAAFQGNHYSFGPYLSPFYSPELFRAILAPHPTFGPKPGWWPAWMVFSPALLIPSGLPAAPIHLLLLSRRLLQGVPDKPIGEAADGEPRQKSYLG